MAVGERTGAPAVNVGLDLARSLHELTVRERPLRVRELREELVESASKGCDVVLLRNAIRGEHARQLVEAYVVSDEKAERLADLAIPHLQFDRPVDNRGILVVWLVWQLRHRGG